MRVHRRRKGERRSMSEADYADLITAAHRQLAAPVVPAGAQALKTDLLVSGWRLAGDKIPGSVRFTDAPPHSATGKVLKKLLRETYGR